MKTVVNFSEKGRRHTIEEVLEHVAEEWKPSEFLDQWVSEALEKARDRGDCHKPDYEIGSLYARGGRPYLISYSDDDFIWEELEE